MTRKVTDRYGVGNRTLIDTRHPILRNDSQTNLPPQLPTHSLSVFLRAICVIRDSDNHFGVPKQTPPCWLPPCITW